MSDYIKREDAIDYLTTNINWFDADGIETSEEEKRADITELVNGVSSADVAPVVRCEDCVFSTLFQNDSSGAMARYCKAFTFERMVADNDFCSYGERKDNE